MNTDDRINLNKYFPDDNFKDVMDEIFEVINENDPIKIRDTILSALSKQAHDLEEKCLKVREEELNRLREIHKIDLNEQAHDHEILVNTIMDNHERELKEAEEKGELKLAGQIKNIILGDKHEEEICLNTLLNFLNRILKSQLHLINI